MAHVAPWKVDVVKDLTGIINSQKVVGIVSIHGVPAREMQKMRRDLREKLNLVVSKKRLISIALKDSDKTDVENLAEHMEGQVGLVATDMNAFKLCQTLQKTKKKAPAKGGEIAPEDVVVPKGETPFKAGPVVAELQQVGIKAAIDKGKVVIRESTTIVKKGEVISRDIAKALTKLEIYPIDVGLDLLAAYEDGTIYTMDVLSIDFDQMRQDMASVYARSVNFAVDIGYVADETIEPLISKAHSSAIALALASGYISPDTIELILKKAYSEMIIIKNIIEGGSQAAPVEEEVKKDEPEDKKDEEEEEEDATAGLGALFG